MLFKKFIPMLPVLKLLVVGSVEAVLLAKLKPLVEEPFLMKENRKCVLVKKSTKKI